MSHRRSSVRLVLAVLLGVSAASCRSPVAPRPTLTLLLATAILSADPNQDVESVTDSVLFNVFETLVAFDENLRVRPLLAESWEVPSAERWRFRLRKNVRFHDGTPFDARAVRDAVERVRANPHLEAGQFLSHVEAVEVVSDHVVDIVTKEPRALLANLAGLYISRPNAQEAFPPLLGTGPYTLKEWQPDARVTVERWSAYWGSSPEFERVQFEVEADPAARLRRVQEGSADVAYQILPELAVETPRGVRFVRRTGITVWYAGFDVRPRPDNPYADVRVRRAVHLALDRDRLVREILSGTGGVPTQPVAPLVFGYDPDLPLPEHDPARARALLSEAGYSRGFRSRLDFPASRAAVARRIQEDLAPVGVQLDLDALPREETYRRAEAGLSAFFLAGWDCSSGEAGELFELLLHTPGRGWGQFNYGHYSSREIDDVAQRNSAILDPRQRKALLQRGAAIAMRDLPLLPLFLEDDIYAVREGLDIVPRGDSELRVAEVRSRGPR